MDFRVTCSTSFYNRPKKPCVLIPPFEEQKRIVAILDRFDALCNDLTSGIPAEIEARQKQYEYYRDKLLSFREVKA
jgi:type I restriction enzyme S subunit